VGRVVLGGVEVHVVRHLERQRRLDLVQRYREPVGELGHLLRHDRPLWRTEGKEVVERGGLEGTQPVQPLLALGSGEVVDHVVGTVPDPRPSLVDEDAVTAHEASPGSRPRRDRSSTGSVTLQLPNPAHSGRRSSSSTRVASISGTGSVPASVAATSAASALWYAACAVATSTLRKPWWMNPVSGSVCRI